MLRSLTERISRSTLARNSGWMFLGFGLRIVVQAGYFILIARALGAEQYGAFVGVAALVAIVAPFATLGTGNLLVKNVSRDPSLFAEYWGNALLMTFVSGIPLLGLILSISRFVLPASIPWSLILLISISDLLFFRICDVAAQAFQATDQLRYTAKLSLLPNVLRFIGAGIVFAVWHRASALCWGWFYMGGTLLCAISAIALTNYKLGSPRLALWRIRKELLEGFYFGTSLSAQTVYNDIDKAMLARLATLDATGIYAAAYRIIDVAFAPVRSVLYAAYAGFFRHGERGITGSYAYAKRILPKVIGYSTFAVVAIYVAAPILPRIIGPEFGRTVEALRWLAVLPLLKTVHYFFAESLAGSGHQGVRTACQLGVAAINVALNLWLISVYSWRGAAWASVLSDGALVIALFGAVQLAHRSTRGLRPDNILGREAAAN